MNNNLLKLIKTNAKYQGNEDLCDDFLSEAVRRSLAVTQSVDDLSFIEPYLKKVVNTSILTVLKNSGRVRRVKNDFVAAPIPVSLEELAFSEQTAQVFSISDIPDPKSDFPQTIENNELLAQVCNAVLVANNTNPNKNYYDIFVKRYVDLKKQAEIAEELGISQSEVCKRLYELVKIIKMDVVGY